VKNFTNFPCGAKNQTLNICADFERGLCVGGNFFGFSGVLAEFAIEKAMSG